MKKICLLFSMILTSFCSFSQSNLVIEAPLNNNTQNINRAPNGTAAHAYYSACFLVLQNELFNIPNGTSITSFGFTLYVGASGTAPAGNFTVHLQNTTDGSYQKGTNFATALSGMTQVFANVMTIPLSANTTSVMVTLSTPFSYSGGGLYVAYDWAYTGPYNTNPASYLGETTAMPLPGGAGGVSFSNLSAQNTLTLTNTRPSFLFGFVNNNSNDVEVLTIFAPGKVPAMLNAAHTVTAVIRNLSNTTLTNITVSLNVSGANSYNNTQMVTSLGAGQLTLVQFAAFNPLNVGMNTLSVSVVADQNNLNNSMTYSQQVTCNEWSDNPPVGNYTVNGVGWQLATTPPSSGAGIISTAYINPVASTITAIRCAIGNQTTVTGNNVYGVLQNNTGGIIATSNTVNLTSGMLGTFVTFTFATPQVLASGTTYYIGMAAMAGSQIYRPYGTIGQYYLPNYYMYSGITGGSLIVLTQNFGYFGFEAVFLPNISLSAVPQSVVCGNTATVQAVSSTNYSWSTGATTSSIVVSPTVSTNYTVVATNTLGCSVSTIALLTVTPFSLSATSSASVICLGDAVTITGAGATTYTWSNNSNATSFVDSPTGNTTYTVTGNNLAGCTSTSAVMVAVQSFSTLSVSPTSTTVCIGSPVSFLAGSANTYTWYTGSSIVNTPSVSATPTASGVYTVTGANPLGCTMSRTVDVIVNSTQLFTTPDTAICMGANINITASGANSYVWNQTYSFAVLPVSPTVSTTYSVSGMGANGCVGNASVTVTVNNNPTVTAVANRTLMCRYDRNVLTAGGADSYLWSNSATTSTIAITPVNTLPQNFTVTGTNDKGCSSSAYLNITVSNCVGLNENNQRTTGISVFPNPTKGHLELRFDTGSEHRQVEVYNTLGQCVFRSASDSAEMSIDLGEQPNGLYIISITDDHQAGKTIRVIKQ